MTNSIGFSSSTSKRKGTVCLVSRFEYTVWAPIQELTIYTRPRQLRRGACKALASVIHVRHIFSPISPQRGTLKMSHESSFNE